MKRLFTIAAAVLGASLLALMPGVALADKRVALVVGNSVYQNVPQLPNPARDADAVGKMFRDAGFESVDVIDNVGNLDFKRAIRKFEDTSADADIAVVFYAGHGIEIGGTNYLVPTDARLASDRDAQDEAIPLERLLSSADGAKKLRIVILDACRDNPFLGKMRRQSRAALRAVSSGLGKVEPTSSDTLIAYAARAGSTAEDGDADHSPFTAALLKNLTVPGRDIRLAFGYIKDDVMKTTSNRQEPFVYGSLGGGNISLVPAPEKKPEIDAEAKSDYELVAKIGNRRAWEVFLNTHKTGFYADLARAQMEALPVDVAYAPIPQRSAPATAPTREALEWDRIKDGGNQTELKNFIRRYPDSPLALTARSRLDVLERAAKEREDQARAEKAEADRKQAEQLRVEKDEADRKKAEAERQKAEAKAEVERKKAEIAAALKRADDERRAQAAEAAQKARAAEAAQKAAEAQRRAEDAERTKKTAEIARLREESERSARAAEAERKKAEAAAALEAGCKQESDRFSALQTKGPAGTGVDDLKTFNKDMTCERLRPQVLAALVQFTTNTPELIRSAQVQLTRINCFTGEANGALDEATKTALGRYLAIKRRPVTNINVTEDLVSEFTRQAALTCPTICPSGQTAKGATCVVNAPVPEPVKPANTVRRRDDDNEPVARKKQPQPKRDVARESRPAPRARQEAAAPRNNGGGGGGRVGGTMIGVGF